MRLFEKQFFWVGLANCVLAIGLFTTAALRYRMTMQYEARVVDMADQRAGSVVVPDGVAASEPPHDLDAYLLLPRFRTAGNVVAFATLVTLAVEIAILVLLLRL